jgi:hypothetical protein
MSNFNPEGFPTGDASKSEKENVNFIISEVLDFINNSKLGFSGREEQVEKALGVLMKENSDARRAADDLKEIVSFLEPGDDFDKTVDAFVE